MQARVSLVEANQELRAGFETFFKRTPGVLCVGSYSSAEEALQHVPLDLPDVVLLDNNLHGMTGIECMSRLKFMVPDLRVLMLVRHEHSEAAFESIRAGASGYWAKHSSPAELIEAIAQVRAGGALMTMQIARRVIQYNGAIPRWKKANRLTAPEQEFIGLIATGHSYAEVGGLLGISSSDVRERVQSVYKKLR